MNRKLLIFLGGLLALVIIGACGQRDTITPNPTGTLELPSLPSMTYDLPVPPEVSEPYTDTPSETLEPTPQVPEQSPRENTTHKPLETPKAKAQKGLSGDDNGDGRIDEDESGWDCANMGNGVCGPTQAVELPAEHSGGIELPTEMWCMVNGQKITPEDASWPVGCPGA